MKNRIIGLFLAYMLLVVPMFVFADPAQPVDYVTEVTEVDISSFSGSTVSQDSEIYQAVYDRLYNTFLEKGGKANILDLHLAKNDTNQQLLQKAYIDAVYDHPELFYVRTWFRIWEIEYTDGTKFLYYIEPSYLDTTEQDAIDFDSKVTYILSENIENGMTDEEKLLAIHDYLVDTCSYAKPVGQDEAGNPVYSDTAFTAYGTIIEGTSVCQGYTLAYNLLINKLGIDCREVISNSMVHSWNMVRLGDNWYHVDVTYDDPTNMEMVNHAYFLLSDETIRERKHYGWSDDLPACTDKRYENGYEFNDARGGLYERFYFKDGAFWYSKDGNYYKVNKDLRSKASVDAADYVINPSTACSLLNPIYCDENGLVQDITVGNIGLSSLAVRNNLDKPVNSALYLAYYTENGILVGIDITSLEFDAETNCYIVDFDSTMPENAGYAKVFLFDADGSIRPLAGVLSI